jgi:hypothetical protein
MSVRQDVAAGTLVGGTVRPEAAVEARGYGIARVFPFFSVAFSLVYFFGVYTGYGPIRYYPILGEWHLAPLPVSPDPGPVMMWYGWVINGFIGGFIVGGLGLLLPREQVERLWDRWVWAPVAVTIVLIVALLVLLSGYFTT